MAEETHGRQDESITDGFASDIKRLTQICRKVIGHLVSKLDHLNHGSVTPNHACHPDRRINAGGV